MAPATARRQLLPRYRPPPPAVRKRHHALPTGADLTALAGPRRRLLRRRFSCLPTHARLCHRPGRCDTDFSHLDCRSVLILIVALHGTVPAPTAPGTEQTARLVNGPAGLGASTTASTPRRHAKRRRRRAVVAVREWHRRCFSTRSPVPPATAGTAPPSTETP